jgi:hypothetical protein
MPQTPSAQRKIFEEVGGTRWAPYEARFTRASKHVMADIEIGHRGCESSVWIDDVAFVASIERAGYTMSDQSGRRSLRADEVAAERIMLERAVARPNSILSWPRRRARKMPAVANRRVSPAIVRSMMTKWEWTVTAVGRRGTPTFVDARVWHAYAWCLVVDDDGPNIEVGIRIDWRKKPPGPEVRAARKHLDAALARFGYVSPNVRGHVLVEKTVRDVAEARDERARLDRFLG